MMRRTCLLFLTTILFACKANYKIHQDISPEDYLKNIKTELKKEWPDNRTINLVFHGHSVPAGFFKTPVVNTLDSYSYQVLAGLKKLYPTAVINIINTAIGGENSVQGEKRFESEVLIHQPDVLFVDYSLNDRRVGLEQAHEAWSSMITKALKKDVKIILLTPSPDQKVDILDDNTILNQHGAQVKQLAKYYGIGIIDSYALYKQKVVGGDSIASYMSQSNHPNKAGHKLIADEILSYFNKCDC